MKESEQDLLLNEILASEELENVRRSTLKNGLAAVRRTRRTRKAALVGVAGFAVIASTVLLVFDQPVSSLVSGNRGSGVAEVTAASPRTQTESFERIGDKELLALFPNQSIALIGAPGHRRLLVFAPSPSQ